MIGYMVGWNGLDGWMAGWMNVTIHFHDRCAQLLSVSEITALKCEQRLNPIYMVFMWAQKSSAIV